MGLAQRLQSTAPGTTPLARFDRGFHFYQHDGGFRAAECEKIGTWYSSMHLYLLQAMDKIVMGQDGHTLLDESVVFFGSELSQPPTHYPVPYPPAPALSTCA